jgi:exonuclease SbcD
MRGINMRILHTGDWHIGKLVHGLHMTEDQAFLLKQFVSYVKVNIPDVIIIAGDLFDRTVPPVEAVTLLDDIFTEIVINEHIPIIAISGNHDSSERLGFANNILRRQGLHISNDLSAIDVPVIIEDKDGPVHFYLIPYADPAVAKVHFKDDSIKTHDDVYRVCMEKINNAISRANDSGDTTTNGIVNNSAQNNTDVSIRTVCITHGFITGAQTLETSESERPLSIGGTDAVDVHYFEDFNYVALGHLHRPQKVTHDHIRYAGSLLKYSFSEATQKKGMTLVEMDQAGAITHELVTFKPRRDMRVITGMLEDLINKDHYSLSDTNDYILAMLTDGGSLYEPMMALRSIYPNILRLERADMSHLGSEATSMSNRDFKLKDPFELFNEFYVAATEESVDEVAMGSLKGAIETVLKGEGI